MRCFICDGETEAYFSKHFEAFDLGDVHYCRCRSCGFVFSKTHLEMSDEGWESLNHSFHAAYQETEANEDDPNWLERLLAQARAIVQLDQYRLLPRARPWLDYACGDGKLSKILGHCHLEVLRYDRYMGNQKAEYITDEQLRAQTYDLVINTSFFEHVRGREPLDEILGLVDDAGVLALHTDIRPEVPRDPGWGYLLPVHCAFFTNRAMQVMFESHGYRVCVHHPDSRLWFWFREAARAQEVLRRIDGFELGPGYFASRRFINTGRRQRFQRQAGHLRSKALGLAARQSRGVLSKLGR